MPKTKALVWVPWQKKDPTHSSSESVLEDASCECIFCVCQALLEKTGKIHSWFIKGFHKSADTRPELEVQERPHGTCVTVGGAKPVHPPRCGNWGTRLPCWGCHAQGEGRALGPAFQHCQCWLPCSILSAPSCPGPLHPLPLLQYHSCLVPLPAVSGCTCTAESPGADLGI